MSTDPHPLAVPAPFVASGPRSATGTASPAPRRAAAVAVVDERGPELDGSTWCRWWRDLIVERYRVDRFDAFVPLPVGDCPWELRVALGRVVEESMVDVAGSPQPTRLVIDAIDLAGFGRVRDLAPDARRGALVRSGWAGDPWPGGDDLRLGVLGSVADALLRAVPPPSAHGGRIDGPAGDAADDAAPVAAATVAAATRAAVFAYARHVEELACRSREVVRSYRF